MLLQKIPHKSAPKTEGVRLSASDEPFVDIEEFSSGAILTDMKYAEASRPGAVTTAYARLGVAEKLLCAARLLPAGMRLKIYDAWRPYSVQRSLYDEYYSSLRDKPENAHLSEEELHRIARRYVSFPAEGKPLSYVHSSGGAIDLTIVGADGEELDMGSGFDDFSPASALSALEGSDTVAEENRRLLYTVMTSVGFTPYAEEWWHYDYGDLFWAASVGEDAIYSSIYREDELDVRH